MSKIILAIETSCDDTSIAILDGEDVLSLKTHSQIEEHQKFGGVIPELASRLHSKTIFAIIELTLIDANMKLTDLEAIAFTIGPGLVNTLQIGAIVAKTLSSLLKIPVYGINHLESHIYSPFIGEKFSSIPKEAIFLLVSGGNTIIGIKNGHDLSTIGETRDDAVGEAFDKVAKILGYSYPGGPIIDAIFQTNKKTSFRAPVSNLPEFDFSYSGLKSAILKVYQEENDWTKEDLARGFQIAAITQLLNKIKLAYKKYNLSNIFVGGGVSANSLLRFKLEENEDYRVFVPKLNYSLDNAAMIGYLLQYKLAFNLIKPLDNLGVDVKPKLKLNE
ncbi:MAG: tRNA (adenosine(37)-N6)-threonylcarbamoyltransferase complex transferase subunit TsaD [Mycoplasmataceae bacterium]|nr:tRNA (adenosine(37)-N6)-threonylcarbamoyltransferase complex transferase subunit TsaD [Mycoplasmataceae bacterium]